MKALARISLKNRALIALIAVCAVVFGTIAANSLKQELFPPIGFTQTIVTAQYDGAGPEAVEREVTEPLEAALNGLESVESVRSTSAAGMSQIFVETDYDTNLDDTVRELGHAVSQVENQLPDGVTPNVMTDSVEDFPVIVTSVTSDLSTDELASEAENVIIPELKKLEGVSNAGFDGLTQKHVSVRVRADDLADEGASVEELAGLLQANGIPTSAGELSGNGGNVPVDVGAKLESIDAIKQLRLQTEDGSVPVSAVADVSLEEDEMTSISRTNGKPSLTLQVTKKPDANTVEVSQAVVERLNELSKQIGQNTTFETVFDQAPFITTSIDNLLHEGALGLIFAILVIFVFLLSVRATIITALSIPLSLLITLVAMWQSDYSLNMLTVAALTMSIGRIVDDSIVVIESIRRRQTLGGTKFANIFSAVAEVSGAITASTLTTVAVFLPLAFVTGPVGQLFRPFAFTSAIALLSSLLVALTVVPVLAYFFLRNRESRVKLSRAEKKEIRATSRSELARWKDEQQAARKADRKRRKDRRKARRAGGAGAADRSAGGGSIGAGAGAGVTGRHSTTELPIVSAAAGTLPFTETQGGPADEVDELAPLRSKETRLQKTYTPVLGWSTAHPWLTIVAAVIVLGMTAALVPLLKTTNLGGMSTDSLQASQTFEPGVSLADADKSAAEVEAILENQNGVKSYQMALSSGTGAFSAGSAGATTASYTITLDEGTAPETIAAELSGKMDNLEDAGEIILSTQDAVGDSSIDVTLASNDLDKLTEGANALTDALGDAEGIDSVSNTLEATAEVVAVEIDKKEAAERGLTEQAIGQFVQRTMNGQNIGQIIIDATSYQVLLFDGEVESVRELRELKIPYQEQSMQASLVPGMPTTPVTSDETVELQDIAEVKETKTAPVIDRTDGLRSVTMSATADGDNLGAVNQTLNKIVAETELPSGVTVTTGGAVDDMREGFRQMGIAMLAATLMVFVILVATFKSLMQPLILLASIPFAATGSVLLLLLTNSALGQTAMIGLLMLIGIVVTNAIVLIDLINHYRAHGVKLRAAVYHGARQRYRPILMTAAATIFAMLPMALGVTGEGSFVSQDMALVVIGGLVSSTLLTLLLVPALYQLLEGWKERRADKRAIKNMARDQVIDAAEVRSR